MIGPNKQLNHGRQAKYFLMKLRSLCTYPLSNTIDVTRQIKISTANNLTWFIFTKLLLDRNYLKKKKFMLRHSPVYNGGTTDTTFQRSMSARGRGGGGGGLPHETDGDARRLALGLKFWILVSLRVFRAKRQYFVLPRSRLWFRG